MRRAGDKGGIAVTEQSDCRGEFPVDVSEKEYVQAALLASRRYGSLRSAPAVLFIGVALLVVGLLGVTMTGTLWAVSLLLCILGPLMVVLFFIAEPAAVRRGARRDYPVFQELMAEGRLLLYPDHAQTVTGLAVLTDPYALMVFCIETPELLVFVKDRERLLILPKRCIPPEQKDGVLEFLRLTFIRKRKVQRTWFI